MEHYLQGQGSVSVSVQIRRPHPLLALNGQRKLVVRSGLFALAGQRSLKTLSGLVFYHCVREGVPGDSGPGEEGEFKLVCFRLGDLKTFFIVSDIVVC